jgi:hypothetical protein
MGKKFRKLNKTRYFHQNTNKNQEACILQHLKNRKRPTMPLNASQRFLLFIGGGGGLCSQYEQEAEHRPNGTNWRRGREAPVGFFVYYSSLHSFIFTNLYSYGRSSHRGTFFQCCACDTLCIVSGLAEELVVKMAMRVGMTVVVMYVS